VSPLRFVRLDSRRGIDFCEEIFGIDPHCFDGLALYQRGRGTLWVAAADLDLDGLRPVDGVGIPILRIDRAVWKLTSAAAIRFGGTATRNVVELDADETAAILRRDPVAFAVDDPRRELPWKAHVIVRYRGVPVGCALWRGDGLESSIPKGRAVDRIDLPG
jgi:NOL1/NOP2/fmu family ribosome biogenesis protein